MPDEGVPQYGGYLQMSAGEDPRSLNFLDNVSAGTGSTLQGVYDRLVRWKFEGGDPVWKEIAPGIADSWSVTDDGLTWTFKLRDDVQFHDGTPLTSADVKATFDHYVKASTGEIDFRPPARSYTGPFIETVEAPDDYTVILNLGAPAAVLLQNLSAAWVNIISKKDYDEHGPEWFVTNANGTGPYRWAPDKWERGVSFELEQGQALGLVGESASSWSATRTSGRKGFPTWTVRGTPLSLLPPCSAQPLRPRVST